MCDFSSGKCECNSGFTGESCKNKLCLNNCSNRGKCKNNTCDCDAGYDGASCENSIYILIKKYVLIIVIIKEIVRTVNASVRKVGVVQIVL